MLERVLRDVYRIVKDVRLRGDKAIADFYENFYGIPRDTSIVVEEDEIRTAFKQINEEFIRSSKRIINRIKSFNEKILAFLKDYWLHEISKGVYVGQVIRPIEKVGAYIPGGYYPYPSTALMTITPGKVAGSKVYVATPPMGRGNPSIDPGILVASKLAGASRIYRLGGAHAAAALAYGTNTVEKTDKIVGPGGIWWSAGKYVVSKDVCIDMIAGPSEIMILAETPSDPEIIAYDMVAQSEHGDASISILVTNSKSLAEEVLASIEDIIRDSPSKARNFIIKNLLEYGAIMVVDNLDYAVEAVNLFAPEHLEILINKEKIPQILSKIRNAGSIYIGEYAPTALGDYCLGTNHVLPTNGLARGRGGLSVLDYVKFIDIHFITPEGFLEVVKDALILADYEKFLFHKRSLEVRINKLRGGDVNG